MNTWSKTIIFLMTSLSCLAAGESIIKTQLASAGVKDLDIKLSSDYQDLAGRYSKAQIFTNSIGLKTKLDLSEELYLDIDAKLSAQTGNAVAVFDEKRNSPSSGFKLSHGFISYSFFDFITLKAGSLDNKNQIENETLINYGVTSMGLRQSVTFSNEIFSVIATATQSRPSNDTLSEKFDGASEGDPKFFSEIIKASISTENLTLSLKGGQYAYENISSEVAYNDRFYGNTVSGTTKTNSVYVYGFKGSFVSGEAILNISKDLSITPRITRIKNQDAPSSKNSGKVFALSAQTKIINHRVSLSMTNFNIDSDTTIAYYNSNDYKNNYQGNEINFELENPNSLTTSISYIKRTVKEESLYLADEKIFKISLGKTYDIF